MARRYEYVIRGPPASAESPTTSPRKSLSVRKDPHRTSNLRTLYRNSSDVTAPQEGIEQVNPVQEQRISSPTTPRLPPTPPAADEEVQEREQSLHEIESTPQEGLVKLRSIPVTPVNGNSPPTPDDTPPREQLRLPHRPLLNLRPSIASTRAESFRTAREQIYSDDDSSHASPDFMPSFGTVPPVPELPALSSVLASKEPRECSDVTVGPRDTKTNEEDLPSSPTLPTLDEPRMSKRSIEEGQDTPETQFMFDHTNEVSQVPVSEGQIVGSPPEIEPSIHSQVTTALTRDRSLRDRLEEKNQIHTSASTEAFANVIGWNDGISPEHPTKEAATNRWSGNSNVSAVEAYVVESPIKPKKRGTLRKVVKNDSLRSVSSPMPKSNRTSLQSASDSQHRLVHKKQKLGNQNRWSTGSDISKRSLSWGSTPAFPKHETIKVAVIPERRSSLQTSSSSSRRHSRSMSTNSGMPPVTSIGPRRKRAFSDSQSQNEIDQMPQIPIRSSSLSAPTSRSGSRANSLASHHVSLQREQAEKDLRTTLDRMESERLSASLRRGSDQSAPSPSPGVEKHNMRQSAKDDTHDENAKRALNQTETPLIARRSHTIDIVNITPGTQEWADLRPPDMTGTPFSQTSMLSTSPEIIEARIINFFPHNNDSVQLIEPNRLSETPAVKALRAENLRRAKTVPERQAKITTPKASDRFVADDQLTVDSPLRNPRKPPDPPQVQFAVIPPSPQSELNTHFNSADDALARPRTITVSGKRPQLQGNERSESFIRTLSRGLSLRNAKNLRTGQDLDSALHPLWRPRAFWDQDELKRRSQLEKRDDETTAAPDTDDIPESAITRHVTILHPNQQLLRSNSIGTGPISLVRKMSERRKQRKLVDDHLAQQQALVKQTSYSSLQRIRAGHKLYGLQPLRGFSLNVNLTRLNSLRERLSAARVRREDERREMRREKLRKSIGADVVSQGDSRFPAVDIGSPMVIEHLGGRKVDDADAINEMLENARAENMVGKRGLRM